MKTKTEQKNRKRERGNALIYVLLAIALFAALSFTLGRQSDTSEAGTLSDERAELYATQIISYAAQAKSVIDQMMFTGTKIDELDFMDPSDANFNTGTQADITKRVYHPEGGGLIKGTLPEDTITQSTTDPVPGWYLGRFNNVEWTSTTNDDVILVAFQISQQICEKINEKITGSTTIPVMTDSIKETMIVDTLHTGTNLDLSTDPTGTPICAECHEMASLCVENQAQNAFGFYTILADQ